MSAQSELKTVAELRAALDQARRSSDTVGLVPTMGFLHAGHASLIEAAARECGTVLVTIFVNPLQFAPGEDFEAYPRDLDRDRGVSADAGATILFVPPAEEMYPSAPTTTVTVGEVSEGLEGVSRPTHFAGVATVVAKLFNLAGPCRAYFGEKDYQQIAVIRRMVRDLSLPVELVACPTVREPDGLAMSSRNAYLKAAERAAAPVLHRALCTGADRIASGERNAGAVRGLVRAEIDAEPLADLDYAEVADPDDLRPISDLRPYAGAEVRLLAAARVGRPRLLDNVGVLVPVGE